MSVGLLAGDVARTVQILCVMFMKRYTPFPVRGLPSHDFDTFMMRIFQLDLDTSRLLLPAHQQAVHQKDSMQMHMYNELAKGTG